MRDPARIDAFCTEFANIWKTYFPDWRFGQLVNNLQNYQGSDLFYLEEEDYLKLLKDFADIDE